MRVVLSFLHVGPGDLTQVAVPLPAEPSDFISNSASPGQIYKGRVWEQVEAFFSW